MTPPAAPTDLELMLFADGELDGERSAAVGAWLEHDRVAHDKLASLVAVSRVVRESANDRPGGDVADSVMRLIDAEPAAASIRDTSAVTGGARRQRRRSDSLRGFYVVGAAVLAAAAAILVWGRHESEAPRASSPQAAARAVVPSAAATAEVSHQHGVEVWSVDFGAASGAVFYVPSGTSPSETTTVVWLSDDPAEEGEE